VRCNGRGCICLYRCFYNRGWQDAYLELKHIQVKDEEQGGRKAFGLKTGYLLTPMCRVLYAVPKPYVAQPIVPASRQGTSHEFRV
jgi:hypothetical protein